MKTYFKLQHTLLNRKIEAIGFNPILGYVLAIAIFYGTSIYLFTRMEFAAYLYALIALSFVSKFSEKRRNEFLKNTFSTSQYKLLRLIENLLIAFPFLTVLLYHQCYVLTILLAAVSALLSIGNFKTRFNYTTPTPFSNNPFEFTIGFRKTFFLFPIAYFLTYQSIRTNNFNLGIFSMLLLAIIVLSYYLKPEKQLFIWIYNLSPKDFLINKILISYYYFTLLILPILIVLAFFFINQFVDLIIFTAISYAYIATIILAKYSGYPNDINLPEGLLIGISLMFPPMLTVIIPFFYAKSIKRLKPLLGND